ncbi:MAG: hypothetical protein ACTHJT_05640 [Cytophaga sp.]|uniref:hypothetical protein n=1 Tax=Cytophaga sp. TaxID=29535 RepID=UPI003F7D484E
MTTAFYKNAAAMYLFNYSIPLQRLLLLVFMILTLQDVTAQNFAQVNQLPLQLNPSLAGAKGKKRISAGLNQTGNEQYGQRTMAVGYDEMSKKLHVGLGIYYLNNKNNSLLITDASKKIFPEYISNKKFYTENARQYAGICIAPKYNIYYKNIPKKIKYTFSPSLFTEAGKEHYSTVVNVSFKEYFMNTFSTTTPEGEKQLDSIHSKYTKYEFSNTFFRTGIGFQFNSGKLVLLSKTTFSINTYQEGIQQCAYSSATAYETCTSNTSLDRTLYTIESNIHAGYTFSLNKKSDFTCTPILGIGIRHYLNMLPSSASGEAYRNNVSNADITQLNYVHASGNFRYQKLLFGACYTKYISCIYNGLTIGYQSDFMKIMLTGGANLQLQKNAYHNIEITTDLFF